jgi:hypothetical protein
MSKTKIKWHKQPQKHDYPAARAYLNLILQPRDAKKIVEKLKRAQVQEFAAKDVLRAANVPLLSIRDSDVKKDRTLIRHKKPLAFGLCVCGHEVSEVTKFGRRLSCTARRPLVISSQKLVKNRNPNWRGGPAKRRPEFRAPT